MKTLVVCPAWCACALLFFPACAEEPRLCATADATFAVDGGEGVRILATLRTEDRQDGRASYEGSWMYAAEVVEAVAIAIVGPGTQELEQDDTLYGDFEVDGREDEHQVEILLIQRLDSAEVLVEGAVSAEAEAPDGCSLELEVEPK